MEVCLASVVAIYSPAATARRKLLGKLTFVWVRVWVGGCVRDCERRPLPIATSSTTLPSR